MSEDLSTLTLVELLDLLEPIPEPVAISLWPQTGAWVWLGLALFGAITVLLYRWLQARRANVYRRLALREIADAGDDPVALAEILRRAALAAFPRDKVAGLNGEAWLAFLDESYEGKGFREGPGHVVASAPYIPSKPIPTPGLAPLVADWVRSHSSDRETRT